MVYKLHNESLPDNIDRSLLRRDDVWMPIRQDSAADVAWPVSSAPVIPLQLASYSKPAQIDVEFDDQRPVFERLYYPGTCEPRSWRDAMSVVPMESFVPCIEDELRQRVANSIRANDPIIARATVILT